MKARSGSPIRDSRITSRRLATAAARRVDPVLTRRVYGLLSSLLLLLHAACGPVRPETAQGRLATAQVKMQRNDFEGAIAECDRACSLEPSNPKCYIVRAFARSRSGDKDGAIADYTRAIDLNPTDPLGWNNRAASKNVKMDYEGAVADCNKAIELNPRFVVAYNTRAYAYSKSGRLELACLDYGKAVEIDPKYAQAYRNLAGLRIEMGDPEGAIREYGRAIDADPRNPWGYDGRGLLLYNRRSWNEALSDFRKACALSGTQRCYARLYIWLIRARLGPEDEASAELREAFKAEKERPVDPEHRQWYRKAASYLLGDIREEDFLALADPRSQSHTRYMKCAGYFYAATRRLIRGDAATAKEYFRFSVESKTDDCLEITTSEAELRFLEKNR